MLFADSLYDVLNFTHICIFDLSGSDDKALVFVEITYHILLHSPID